MYTGQGCIPRTWHPFANIPSEAELRRRMELMSSDVQKRRAGLSRCTTTICVLLRRAAHAREADVTAPSRTASVNGRDVFVFDGLATLEETARYFAALSQASFTRTEKARPDSDEFRHWVCEMPLENLPRISLWPATQAAVASARPGEQYHPYRVYTNYASFGDTLLTHVDALPNARELTALWFVAEHWDTEWGGETLFYDDAGDAQIAVSPRPGTPAAVRRRDPSRGQAAESQLQRGALHLRDQVARGLASRGSC